MRSYDIVDIYQSLIERGKPISPRSQGTLEIQYFQGYIDNFWSLHPLRKYDLSYFKREFQWFLTGDAFNHDILPYAKMWRKLVQPDGSIFSNYGQFWFGWQNGFEWVVNTLKKDPDSRQAYIPMNNFCHATEGNPDFVCTKGIQFRQEGTFIHMHVAMRSTDVIFGMGTDLPCFYFFWMMVCNALGKSPGSFIFSTDSLHLYDRHQEMVIQVLKTPHLWESPEYPELTDYKDLLEGRFESEFGQWLKESPL